MKLGKVAKRIFVVIFCLLCIIDFVLFLFIMNDSKPLTGNVISDIFQILLLIVIVLIYNISRFSLIIGIWFAIKMGKRSAHKEKLNKDDVNNKDYFRSILRDYSPIELSYIDDFNIECPKDIITILLDLKNRKIIEFNEKEEKIEYIENNETLTKVEEYILNKIFVGKIKIEDKEILELKKIVQEDSLNKKILENDTKIINLKFVKKFILICALLFIVGFIFQTNIIGEFILFIFCAILMSLPFLMIYFFVYILSYNNQKLKNPYQRSKLGEEVNRKLEGLKNYLKDFSSINKKEIEEIVIWEDYLIYSVLFNQNIKVINEIYNKYFIK